MRRWRFIQYRLATLFLVTTCAAVALWAWMRFVAPNVTGFHFENGQLVIHLSDEAGRAMFSELYPVANGSGVFVHSTFVSFPLYVVAMVLALMLGFAVGMYFGLRKLVGGPKRRSRGAK